MSVLSLSPRHAMAPPRHFLWPNRFFSFLIYLFLLPFSPPRSSHMFSHNHNITHHTHGTHGGGRADRAQLPLPLWSAGPQVYPFSES